MHYQCPICDEKVSRDFAHFLEHGNQHVIDSIRKAHPDWEREDGVCQKCVEYYQKVLRGEPTQGNENCGKKLK
jgi:hypothetical protein